MNPFGGLVEIFLEAAAKVWINLMLMIWGAGLWVLRLELRIMDAFLTPDLSADGPMGGAYPITAWIGMCLATIMLAVQIGTALLRRDGASLARIAVGAAQYIVVMSSFVVLAVAVVDGCSAMSRALMDSMLGVTSWADWSPFTGDYTFESLTDAAAATVLAVLGCVLWFAGIGHILVMLTRDVALIVLVATAPIAAAGLVSDVGRGWFWKALRWFAAASFSAPLVVLVLGIGVQIATTAVTEVTGDDVLRQIATVIGGVVTICVACVAPLALFRLLAFVDPSTSSGAAMRAGFAASGGLQGILTGAASSSSSSGSGAASSSEDDGTSTGEAAGQGATASRFAAALGPLGAGVGLLTQFGTSAASIGSDLANQMGVGHGTYTPDMSAPRRRDTPSNGGGGGSMPGRPPAGPPGTGAPGAPGPGAPSAGAAGPGGPAASGAAGGSSAEAAEAAALL